MRKFLETFVTKFPRVTMGGIIMLTFANVVLWVNALSPGLGFELDFLNVGQGDSTLLNLPGGSSRRAVVLVDAGPATDGALRELDSVLGVGHRTLDLVIVTHPEIDHYGGLFNVLGRYRVGMIVSNGRPSDSETFRGFVERIRAEGIPWVNLSGGDRILYGSSAFDVISPRPGATFGKSSQNEAGLVLELSASGVRTLFMADTGERTEEQVRGRVGTADILKVGHHGSKFSSGVSFLSSVRPLVALIGVGKNSYGHPTGEVLARLSGVGASVFRTDRGGMVRIVESGGALHVSRE